MNATNSRRFPTIIGLTLLLMPRLAFAHPMGNFSINHYTRIVPQTNSIVLEYIIDMAEIPTFQEMQQNLRTPE
jgi:nickel/cobalt transporter (NicO) family protein